MSDLPIGNRVKPVRRARSELTQARLAEIIGVTRQTIVAIETERYAPSLELAMKLSAALGLSVDELFFWKDPAQTDALLKEGEKK